MKYIVNLIALVALMALVAFCVITVVGIVVLFLFDNTIVSIFNKLIDNISN